MFILITVGDADGDHVRCRWTESFLNECEDICRGFPATLKGRQVGKLQSILRVNNHDNNNIILL